VIALQIRRNDERLRRLACAISDQPTLLCLRAEREFLRLLEGDCGSPVGVHATMTNEKLRLQAQVFAEGTLAPQAGAVTGESAQPEKLAAALMEKLYGN
jgi:porphobilinogen deaminase